MIGLFARNRAAPRPWLVAGPLCLAILVALPFMFGATVRALVAAWNGVTAYSYCFLILPICAHAAWERRNRLLATDPRPSLAGLALLLAAGTAWLLGALSGSVVVCEFALVGMAQGAVVGILGVQAARVLLFPLAYLLFLVPVGESLIPTLQSVTADCAVALLELAGIPVHSDGLIIALPGMTWLVAEACAGLKFLIASVALGALLSEMFLKSWRRRILFMALSVAVPVFANGVRVFAVVAIGYLTQNQYAAEVDHILYGWVLFALVLLGMTGIAVAMREPADETAALLRTRSAGPAAPPSAFLCAALGSLLVMLSVRAGAVSLESSPADPRIPVALPLQIDGPWSLATAHDRAPPIFPGADRVWHRTYSHSGRTLYLTFGYFASERPGAQIASSSNKFGGADPRPLVAEGWRRINAGSATFDARILTFGATHRRLLCYWYWVGGRYTADPYLAKLLQLKAKLSGAPGAAAIVSISTEYPAHPGQDALAASAIAGFARGIGGIGAP